VPVEDHHNPRSFRFSGAAQTFPTTRVPAGNSVHILNDHSQYHSGKFGFFFIELFDFIFFAMLN
jgi:hypothetical protein